MILKGSFLFFSVKPGFTAKPYGIAPTSLFTAAALRLQNPLIADFKMT